MHPPLPHRPARARALAMAALVFAALPLDTASADILYSKTQGAGGKRFLEVAGDWGGLEVGQTDGARSRLVAPKALPLSRGAGSATAKLTYYTPPLRGFEVGASYTPMPRGAADAPDFREARHLAEAAVRKTVRVGAARARLTAGTSRARVRADSRRVPRQSWIVGTQFAWDRVSLDGDLRRQVEADGEAVTRWNAALAYGGGDLNLSVALQRAWSDGASATGRYVADVSYRVRPGWQLVADTGLATGGDDAGAVVTLGARFRF